MDLEMWGLHRLLQMADGMSYATIARAWARVRSRRNAEALARMRRGDSSAGMRQHGFPGFTTSVFAYERARMLLQETEGE